MTRDELRAVTPQVVTAYDTLKAEIAVIAEQMDLRTEDVICILATSSPRYREEFMGENAEIAELMSVYKTLARFSPVDSVKEKATRFLINELKGRNDIGMEELKLKREKNKIDAVDLSLKIAQFNETINKTRARISETLQESTTPKLENAV